jgi:hypothetical protein
MHTTITDKEANKSVVEPSKHELVCMDCAHHLIMDRRLLIKRDEYQELMRVKREYEALTNRIKMEIKECRKLIRENKRRWEYELTPAKCVKRTLEELLK